MDTNLENNAVLNSQMKLRVTDNLTFPLDPRLHRILSPKSKYVLTLPSDERTDEDILYLLIELEDFEFFSKFSNETKQALAKSMTYTIQNPKTVVIERSEVPKAMYVILSGVISMKYKMPSKPDENLYWPQKFLTKGDYFGHEDLIHKKSSLLQVQCVGYSELLHIKDRDFDNVRQVLEEENRVLGDYLRSCLILGKFNWSNEEYRVLETFSGVDDYLTEQEIFNVSSGRNSYWSYFVVSGECKLARKLAKRPLPQKPKERKQIFSIHETGKDSKELEFETVREGFYFGVGEDFGDNSVFATATTVCLKVPRLMLVFKNNKLLQKMAQDLTEGFPTDAEILENYSNFKKSTREIEDMFRDMFKDRPWRLRDFTKQNEKPPFVKYV